MELTIEQALQKAVEAHKVGKLQDAEVLYRAILQSQPKHPDANHNLGVMAVSLNKTEAAIPLFKIALEANPTQGQFWLSYVDALIKEKEFDSAISALEQGKKRGLTGEKVDLLEAQLSSIFSIQKQQSLLKNKNPIVTQQRKKTTKKKDKKNNTPRHLINLNQPKNPPQIELNTPLEHYKKGQYDLAQHLATTLTQQYPNHPFGWKLLGASSKEIGKLQDSLIANQKVLEISPNDAEAHSNLGSTLQALGRLEEAETSYKKAIAIKPDLAEAHSNLGNTLKELDRLEEAKTSYKKAIAIKPDYADAHSNLGNTLQALGRLEEAETSYKKTIAIKPDYAGAHYNLGITLQALGRLEEAETSYKKAIAIKPDYADAHSNLGNTLQALGRLEEAETSYKKAIAIKPDYAGAHYNLGITLQVLGRLEEAETSYKKAIAIKPDYADANYNLGIILQVLGRLEEAETSYKKAIAIKPDLAEAHSNLGITLQELGRLEEAETSYKKAIAIKPDYADAHSNLGITLKVLGRLEEAESSYKKAIAIKPDYADAHSNLGITLQVLGRLEEAETSYKKAIAIKPDYADAHSNLGITLQELGRLEDALVTVIKSIKIKPSVLAKSLFIDLKKKIGIQTWDQSLAQLVIAALLEPWARPSYVMPIACRLLKTNTVFLQILNESKNNINQPNNDESLLVSISKKEFGASTLLKAMLSSSPIPDREIEIFLTSLRQHLLKVAASVILKEDETEKVAVLYCSLAQQCFINEYVFFQTQEEVECSHQLFNQLTKTLEDNQTVPAVWIIAVACYFPLYAIAGSEKLLHQKWSDEVKSVLKQQIQEPLEELNLRASIPILTSIDNQVSLAVQSQYEENPYPRWMRLPKDSYKKFLNSDVQSRFPLSPFRRLVDDRNPEILIAGCGTGQHSIGTSQQYKGARILAVDLSMASLAYAKRKTTELDIEFIEYAQADLLKLASLGRTFDVIESSGVLHHLENPFEGWEVLLSLLRPHGLMRLGFYSEIARRDIVRVRNLISSAGVGSSSQEIRDYRKHLLVLNDSEDYGFAVSSSDFFSTSACRDLLFHVQEHRMNLKILAVFFKDHDLNFLGFDIDSSVIRAYKNRFPNDPSATNLDQWHIYEEENPNTFATMYQFWIQKNISSLPS